MSFFKFYTIPAPRQGTCAGSCSEPCHSPSGRPGFRARLLRLRRPVRARGWPKKRLDPGHLGKADLHLRADSRTWLRFLAKEANLVWALLRGKVRLKGKLRLLPAFARCFPS